MQQDKLTELAKTAQILRHEVNELRNKLLCNEGQIVYRIFRFAYVIFYDLTGFLRKPKTYVDISEMKDKELRIYEKEKEIYELKKNKRKLEIISRSPFIIIVFFLAGVIKIVSFLPSLLYRLSLWSELKGRKNMKTVCILGDKIFSSQRGRTGQLAYALSKLGYRVFYIENKIEKKQNNDKLYEVKKLKENLFSVCLKGTEIIETTYQIPKKELVFSLKKAYAQFEYDLNVDLKKTYYKIDHPFWGYVIDTKKRKFVYEISYTKDFPPHLIQKEKQLMKESNAIIGSTKKLLKKKRIMKSKKAYLIPNGTDYNVFEKASVKTDTCSVGLCWIRRPVIGCIGATDLKVDERLLDCTAKAFPKASIVLEGAIYSPAILEVAEKHPNIFFIGEKPYEKLKDYIQTFDICIMPYWKEIGEDDPEELYDYMAAGKAVVVTISSLKRHIKHLVYDSHNEADFILQIHRALKEKSKEIIKTRQLYAKKNTWEKRAKQMERIFYKITNNK